MLRLPNKMLAGTKPYLEPNGINIRAEIFRGIGILPQIQLQSRQQQCNQ